ncbi:hypothetical protein H3V53_36180 [Paraburkholderia bengalensis]|uniref:Uncharacterized protein n=1 Tax=Paraburkholderia bengalensis TaxID=2747562 RepID=A0ABU8J342_9BURK
MSSTDAHVTARQGAVFLTAGRDADASTGPYNYLQHLKFAVMVQGEARRGDWSVFADTIYNFGRHASSVNATNGQFRPGEMAQSLETSFRGALNQIGAGRTVRRQSGNIDVVEGMRTTTATNDDACALTAVSITRAHAAAACCLKHSILFWRDARRQVGSALCEAFQEYPSFGIDWSST